MRSAGARAGGEPIPRLWPESTIVCLGGGPSLTPADVEAVRDRARVIAINDAYRLAPWADVLYACDAQWWRWHAGAPSFAGRKVALEPTRVPGVHVLRNTGGAGLELDPAGLRTGSNSGYQAINLAVHFGARRVLLLGYDMAIAGTRDHWFGAHPNRVRPPVQLFRAAFVSLVAPLAALGVAVINCSRHTALEAFPRQPLSEALP